MVTHARINAARPLMLQRQLSATAAAEVWKGGLMMPAPVPVALEPFYRRLRSTSDVQGIDAPASLPWVEEIPEAPGARCRLRIHLSPAQDTRWDLAEAFPRQLDGLHHRVSFEVGGNMNGLSLWLTCHQHDLPIVATAFESTFDQCRLERLAAEPWADWSQETWDHLRFVELGGAAPYSKPITNPMELPLTPLATVLHALSGFPKEAWGQYQVLFQPVDRQHNWHRNIAALYDYEFVYRLTDGAHPALKSYQQMPSGDQKALVEALHRKAHDDKPMFAAAARIFVTAEDAVADAFLRSLETFTGLVRHAGRPLARGTVADYQRAAADQASRQLLAGQTYRPGFMCNSAELSALVHLPPPAMTKRSRAPLRLLDTLPPSQELRHGKLLGFCDYAGETIPVCIPEGAGTYSQHLIGRPRMGKSVLIENQCLDDIKRGHGCAVIDPHGDLVQGILDRITPEQVDQVILLDWTAPTMVPLFNPFFGVAPEYRGRVADDFVASMRAFIDGFGHRLEHLLRLSLHGLLHLPAPCLLDVADALSTKSPESKLLRQEVLKLVEDPLLKRFWGTSLDSYSSADLSPPQNKLSLMLGTPPVSYTFQQNQSAFTLRQVMDEQKILLVNLAGIGLEIQSTIGCLLLSLFQTEALARSRTAAYERQHFHIYVDEAHRFVSHSIESMLIQCPKFRVSLTLAHQYLRQFAPEQVDALSSVDTSVIFNVDRRDAECLSKDLQEKVGIEDILNLRRGEAIARLGTEVVRLHTQPPRPPVSPSCAGKVIERCHRLYYKPVDEIKRRIADRHNGWPAATADLAPGARATGGRALSYETF